MRSRLLVRSLGGHVCLPAPVRLASLAALVLFLARLGCVARPGVRLAVGLFLCDTEVVAGLPVGYVVAGAAEDVVIALSTQQPVVSDDLGDEVAETVSFDSVVAPAAIDDVVAT